MHCYLKTSFLLLLLIFSSLLNYEARTTSAQQQQEPSPPPPSTGEEQPGENNDNISYSITPSIACTLVKLYFGIPFFSDGNLTLKEVAGRFRFEVPLFMTLAAQMDERSGQIIFDTGAGHNTHFIDEPNQLLQSLAVTRGQAVVSMRTARRRLKWNRELVTQWEVRPPRDMIDNIALGVHVSRGAFSCEMTYGEWLPVGNVRLSRRYSQSQIFFVRGMLTLGDVVAYMTAASSVNMVAHALQKSHVLGLFFNCELGDDFWYDMVLNPLRLEVGQYYGNRARGAVLGNILFFFGFAGLMFLLAVGVTFYRRRNRYRWKWRRCFAVPPPTVPYKLLSLRRRIIEVSKNYFRFFCPRKSLSAVRWPGIMFIPFGFLTQGIAQGSTELVRRRLGAEDVVLGLVGFFFLAACFSWSLRVLRQVRSRTVSSVVSVPEKDVKLVTKFDRFCEFIRYHSFRFTTSAAAWFPRRRQVHRPEDEDAVSTLLRGSSRGGGGSEEEQETIIMLNPEGGGGDRQHGAAAAATSSGGDEPMMLAEISSTNIVVNGGTAAAARKNGRRGKNKKSKRRKADGSGGSGGVVQGNAAAEDDGVNLSGNPNKWFVDEYGPLFDAFGTIAYWFAAVDVLFAFVIGVLVATKPTLGPTRSCAVVSTIMALLLSIHCLLSLWFRPWSTSHNRFFSIAFQVTLCAMTGVILWGVFDHSRDLQHRVDQLDLIVNGIALLKLFFDMVSLLLMPSLGGFFGYIFGSSSYRMMRQAAWDSEMKRREKVKQDEEQAAQEDEEEEEEEEQVAEELPAPAQDDDDDKPVVIAEEPKPKPKQGNRFKVVGIKRVIRKRIVVVQNGTPRGTPEPSDEEKEDLEEEEEHQQESEEEEPEYNPPPPPPPPPEPEPPRGLSSLARFQML